MGRQGLRFRCRKRHRRLGSEPSPLAVSGASASPCGCTRGTAAVTAAPGLRQRDRRGLWRSARTTRAGNKRRWQRGTVEIQTTQVPCESRTCGDRSTVPTGRNLAQCSVAQSPTTPPTNNHSPRPDREQATHYCRRTSALPGRTRREGRQAPTSARRPSHRVQPGPVPTERHFSRPTLTPMDSRCLDDLDHHAGDVVARTGLQGEVA
jgi:hypothetical protein